MAINKNVLNVKLLHHHHIDMCMNINVTMKSSVRLLRSVPLVFLHYEKSSWLALLIYINAHILLMNDYAVLLCAHDDDVVSIFLTMHTYL